MIKTRNIQATSKLIYPEESYAIMGACFNVYKNMGCGFLEAVYQQCMKIEFDYLKIPYVSQAEFELSYRDIILPQKYKVDFICYKKIILEIKAVNCIIDEYRAQIQNYLNAGKFELGILINFGHFPKLEYERFVLTNEGK